MANGSDVVATNGSTAPAQDWVRYMPWACFAMVSLVAVASAISAAVASASDSPDVSAALRVAEGLRTGALTLLAGLMIVWFIRAFTYPVGCETDSGTTPVEELYRRQIFIFAYAFTFISFVVVAAPTGNLLGGSDTAAGAKRAAKANSFAPITMFYGCFYFGQNAPERPIPQCDEITIARVQTERLAKLREQKADLVVGTAAPRSPETGAAATRPDATPTSIAPAVPTAKQEKPDEVRKDNYALLLAVGGQAALQLPALEGQPPISVVSGGLVLPLYVVLVAMIGGAISLSRRIPEIQKRTDPSYPGTSAQTKLKLYEAREQVVFQIMQLVSAPFIAICSFHVLEPKGTPSAVALAFGSGFASETILLMIRGVVDGLRPGVAQTIATETTPLNGIVLDEFGKPYSGADVTLPDAKGVGVAAPKATSGSDGRFLFNNLTKRRYAVEARSPDGRRGHAIVDTAASTADVIVKLAPIQAG